MTRVGSAAELLAGVWRATRIRRIAAVAVAVFLMGTHFAQAQQSPSGSTTNPDLTDKSLEDLMNTQVTSVSKKEQKLSKVAAAIFVITQEDIRRSGATNIPDLLRMVPGMDVGEINGSTWAVSARGFNAQYSNKLLVMIDGRVVYTPNFAGVYWDTMDYPLENIERIEVIRGPGGSVWGVNAVNGVISIFTKAAAETRGGLIEAGAGNIEQGFGLAQYGGELGKATDYRVYAKYFNQYHLANLSGRNGFDDWHILRSGFRTDSRLSPKDNLTLEGSLYIGREDELGFVLPSISAPGYVAEPVQINMGGGFVQAVWNHSYSDRSDSTLQFSYGRYARDDPQEPEVRDTIDLDYKHHIAWGGRQDLVWGLGYRFTTDHFGSSITVAFDPPGRSLELFNAFVQDEIELTPKVNLTVGTKLEHNSYTGFEIIPSVRSTWAVSSRAMLWAAVSRALRAPSRNDTDLIVNLGGATASDGTPILFRFLGNPDFQDERMIAYEAGYRSSLSNRLSLDVAAFYNDYNNLQTTEPSSSFLETSPAPPHEVQTFTYQNLMYGETHGVEVSANWRATNRWTLSPGYALELLHMHVDPTSADTETPHFVEDGAPRHSAQLRSHFDAEHQLTWDAAAYFVDRLSHQGVTDDQIIPAYTRFDSSLTWKPREQLSVTLAGQNLLQDHHVEFEDFFGSMQSGEIKRSGYVQFVWRF